MPQPWPRTLPECPRLVIIRFTAVQERAEVDRRLARANFPYQWIDGKTIVAPEGASTHFVGLNWSLEAASPQQRLRLEQQRG